MTAPTCQLWLETVPDQATADDLAALSDDERGHCQRLVRAADRARYARAHRMLREALQAATGKQAGRLVLVPGHNSRPRLQGADDSLDFNLTHAGAFAACAVSTAGRVGVDVETVVPGFDFQSLLYRVATKQEQARLAAMDEPDARRHFYRLWVLKEALGKAIGEGVGLPFDRIRLCPDRGNRLACDLAALGEHGAGWQFTEIDLGEGAVMALALRATDPVPLEWCRGRGLARSVGGSHFA